MTPDLQPQIQRTKRIDLIYRVFLFVLIVYMVAVVTYSAVKISEQTTFIINYLRCIGQTPQQQRGPKSPYLN